VIPRCNAKSCTIWQTLSITSTTPLPDCLQTRHKAYCCYFVITIIICTYDELTADRLNMYACFLTTECHGDGKCAKLCVRYFAHILDYTVLPTTTTTTTTTSATTTVKAVLVRESTMMSSPRVDRSTTSKPGLNQLVDLSELHSLHRAFLSKFVDFLFFIFHFISSFISVHSLFVVRQSNCHVRVRFLRYQVTCAMM